MSLLVLFQSSSATQAGFVSMCGVWMGGIGATGEVGGFEIYPYIAGGYFPF